MKKRTKTWLTVLCLLLLLIALVMGTLAWLTSRSTITNTFTVGKVKITLDELRVDENGAASGTKDRVNGTNHYLLVPGHTYYKDPTVHVQAGSESCYLFVKVGNGFASVMAEKTIETQMKKNGWVQLEEKGDVWYYAGEATKEDAEDTARALKAVPKSDEVQDFVVFESFAISESATNDRLYALGSATITVTAYAIQEDGMSSKTTKEIWDILKSE